MNDNPFGWKLSRSMKSHIVDTFSEELHCTVRDCIDCGCLVPGGPTRCMRCANETDPWHRRLRRWFRSFTTTSQPN